MTEITRRQALAVAGTAAAATVLAKISAPQRAEASTSYVITGVDSSYMSTYKSLTGDIPQCLRVYLKGGDSIPGSISDAGLGTYYQAGQSVVYSVKPDESPSSEQENYDNLNALCKNIASSGYAGKTWIALHHEPYPELSASQFTSMYTTYAPAVRGAGVRCGVIFHTYPLYHGYPTYGTDYTNGILPTIDFIGIDTYPGDTSAGYSADILETISPFTSLAKNNGKPFLITEVGYDSSLSGAGTSAEGTWMKGLDGLGANVRAVLYFGEDGGTTDMSTHSSITVPAWNAVVANMASRG